MHPAPPVLAQILAKALRHELSRPAPGRAGRRHATPEPSGETLLAAIATVLAAHVAPPFRWPAPDRPDRA